MSSFLNFLNTADIDTLTRIPSVTHELAESIISARPFDTEDDVLKIKDMDKATLEKIHSFAEAQAETPENNALVPVTEEAMPAPVEKTPPAQNQAEEKEPFLKRLGRAFKWFLNALLRLILLLILFTAVGAVFYYGLPYIQKTFIAPLDQNTAQIQSMESEIANLQTQVDGMNTRVTALEGSVEAHTAAITKLEEMQATLETQIEKNNDAVLLELKHEVMLTRALDVLARARLYLAQSNFGLARMDVQTTRDLLAELEGETDDEILTQAITRLDLALGNLPAFPVVAAGDLEIAWQVLITGDAPVIPTATPTPLSTETPTAESTLEITPTATP